MIILDLTKGITETDQYKAFKFPGGEIHFKMKAFRTGMDGELFILNTRLNSSDEIMFLAIVSETLKKTFDNCRIEAFIPYMPYQQADRDFSKGECFSLKTITNILNTLPVDRYKIFDPHSDVSPALLKNCETIDNSNYITQVINMMSDAGINDNGMIMLAPDSGAFKKIFKLAEKINFKGSVECANKARNVITGDIFTKLPNIDLYDRKVLIVDDICVGGRTFTQLAEQIHTFYPSAKLHLAVSHGIFSNGFTELNKWFEHVYTTNSRTDIYTTDMFGKIPQEFLSIIKII